MDDRTYELLEAKVRAQDELIANLYFEVFMQKPDSAVQSYEQAMRAGYEASLTNPGAKAPSEFIRHATLHELDEFWRVFWISRRGALGGG